MSTEIRKMTSQELANCMSETLNSIVGEYGSISEKTQAESIAKPTLQRLPYYIMLAAMCEEILQRKILVPDDSAQQTGKVFRDYAQKLNKCETPLNYIVEFFDKFRHGQDFEEAFFDFIKNGTTEQYTTLLAIAMNAKIVTDYCLKKDKE